MAHDNELPAIRAVVMAYLEGMIYGNEEQLRSSMHPLCMQAGHFLGKYEFMPRDEFITAIAPEPKQAAGSPIVHDYKMIDVTADTAIVKVTDDCFGTSFTDYLTLIKHDGRWQIVMKAFYDHANG